MDNYEDKFGTLLNQIDVAVINCSKKVLFRGFKKNSKSNQIISERQFHILYIITKRNINSTSDLAKFFNLSKSNISIITSKLVKLGCLKKIESKCNDGRRSGFEVTSKGQEQIDFYVNKIEEQFSEYYKDLFDDNINLEFFEIITLVCDVTNIPIDKDNIFETILILMIFTNIYFENVFARILKDKDINISKNDCNLLYMISTGINSIDDISFRNNISHSTLSIQINNLVNKGLLIQKVDKEDKRKKSFRLSSEAEIQLKNIFKDRTNLIIQDIKTLEDFERENILLACDKILKILNLWINKI